MDNPTANEPTTTDTRPPLSREAADKLIKTRQAAKERARTAEAELESTKEALRLAKEGTDHMTGRIATLDKQLAEHKSYIHEVDAELDGMYKAKIAEQDEAIAAAAEREASNNAAREEAQAVQQAELERSGVELEAARAEYDDATAHALTVQWGQSIDPLTRSLGLNVAHLAREVGCAVDHALSENVASLTLEDVLSKLESQD